jgi:hypothetical protein
MQDLLLASFEIAILSSGECWSTENQIKCCWAAAPSTRKGPELEHRDIASGGDAATGKRVCR